MRRLALGILAFALPFAPIPAEAEGEAPASRSLELERLPPEAPEVTRDLYAHGWFVEAALGARGYRRGAGRLLSVGPYLGLGVGRELWTWLWLKVSLEASMHQTTAPAPPRQDALEIVGAFGELRLQAALGRSLALWASGEVGVARATTDVLTTYGFARSDHAALCVGGTGGLDWHFGHRHYSAGLAAGVRTHPGLDGSTGKAALGVHGAVALRYVF